MSSLRSAATWTAARSCGGRHCNSACACCTVSKDTAARLDNRRRIGTPSPVGGGLTYAKPPLFGNIPSGNPISDLHWRLGTTPEETPVLAGHRYLQPGAPGWAPQPPARALIG